jgi:hypothetical protein
VDDKKLNDIVTDEDIQYIKDDDVIDDTLCPKCLSSIDKDTEFCECGFFVKASKDAAVYSFVFFILVFVSVVGVVLLNTDFLPSLGIRAAGKITDKQMVSSASPVIMVQNKLQHAGMYSMISDIYQMDYKNPNTLIVVIKPERWPTLKQKQKEYVLNKITDLWTEAYKGENPSVKFANAD